MTMLFLVGAIAAALIAAEALRKADEQRYAPPRVDPRPASWQPEAYAARSHTLDHPPTRAQALNSLSTIIAEQRQRSL